MSVQVVGCGSRSNVVQDGRTLEELQWLLCSWKCLMLIQCPLVPASLFLLLILPE